MHRIISELNLRLNKELCAGFVDWQKASDIKTNQNNADPSGNWYRLWRRNIDHQTVHGSEFVSTTRPKGDKKCEDWKRS